MTPSIFVEFRVTRAVLLGSSTATPPLYFVVLSHMVQTRVDLLDNSLTHAGTCDSWP